MSRFDAATLYALLPAVYRKRDAESGGALRELVEILSEQAQIVERDIQRLHDNSFVETCDPWVVPYIGDLLGIQGLRARRFGQRAFVANRLGHQSRKGTAAQLEGLARDVTGWPARVVEYFELLSWAQYLNHVRCHAPATADFNDPRSLEHVDGPFDRAMHLPDVRRIAQRRGRHNIRNVGLYLWRLQPLPLKLVEPTPLDGSGRRFAFSTLGNDTPLFSLPLPEEGATHIATEHNVPQPIRMRALEDVAGEQVPVHLGATRSIALQVLHDPGNVDEREWHDLGVDVVACDLGDPIPPDRPPPDTVGIDPRRGRVAFGANVPVPPSLRLSYHTGFASELGGGGYERGAAIAAVGEEVGLDSSGVLLVGDERDPKAGIPPGGGHTTLREALDHWADPNGLDRRSAIIEIRDSRTYEEDLGNGAWRIGPASTLVIRAANEQRPTLRLAQDLRVEGEQDSGLILDGLLFADAALRVGVHTDDPDDDGSISQLNRLLVQHCTFVPGLSLQSDGRPMSPGATSLVVEPAADVTFERSIVGRIEIAREAELSLFDTIADAGDPHAAAIAGLGSAPGGSCDVRRSTVVGAVDARWIEGDSSIFLGRIEVEQRQRGCLRFCFVMPDSRVPRRYQCHPAPGESLAAVRPRFTSLRCGDPGYGQLDPYGPPEILRGAEDESEMGAFSHLQQPQREADLRLRLDEYLPVGLEAGIFYAT